MKIGCDAFVVTKTFLTVLEEDVSFNPLRSRCSHIDKHRTTLLPGLIRNDR